MGSSFSKDRFGKIQDFSLPFMNPDLQKSPDEWKVLEDEKNRALADKKRFAVRLSEVEETLAKKADRIRSLEQELQEINLKQKLTLMDLQSAEAETALLRNENKLHLSQIQSLRSENSALLNIKLSMIPPSPESPTTNALASMYQSTQESPQLGISSLQESEEFKKIWQLLDEKDGIAATYAEQLRSLQDEVAHFKTLQLKLKTIQEIDCLSSPNQDYKSKDILSSVVNSVDHSADSLTSTEIV